MIHLLLGALAVASPKSELLRLMDDADADPVVAFSCAPLGPLTRLLETIELPGFDPHDAPPGSWMSLLTESRLASAGVDVSGSLTVLVFDDQQLVIDVTFTGSERQASAVVASLLGLGDVERGTFSWRNGEFLVSGHRLPRNLVRITLGDDRLTVRTGRPSAGGSAALRRLVGRVEADRGCALTFDGPLPRGGRAERRGRAPPRVTGMIHVPLADSAPAVVHFHTASPVPTALAVAPGAPVGGSTAETPAAVMSIGVSLGDLLLDPALREPLDISEDDVVELLSRVRFGPGATVAFFPGEPRLGFVANLDATRADGRPVGPRRARRGLSRMLRRIGLPTRRRSPRELEIALDESTVWVATRTGGLVIGSDRDRVAEAATGRGRPWTKPDFAALASRHPVALRSSGVRAGALPPVAADLGIRTVEGLWRLTIGLQVAEDRRKATHTALAATLGSIVLPHVVPRRDAGPERGSPSMP